MRRCWPLVAVIGTFLAGCGQATVSPSGGGVATGGSNQGEPVVLEPERGSQTLEAGVTYLAADFDPPFTLTPTVGWEAAVFTGDRGRNVGELTLRLGDVAVHFEQPAVSDVQGGQRVPAPETLDDFIAALETVPGVQWNVEDPVTRGDVTTVRIDGIIGGADNGGGWPKALFGVDELCIGPDVATRFYLVELSDRVFFALPPCQPTTTNEDWSAAVETLLGTLGEPLAP